MSPGRRLALLVAVLVLLSIPPVVARTLCLGGTCAASTTTEQVAVPFCGLPDALRSLVASGFRSGRSPDVLGVADSTSIASRAGPAGDHVAWPQVSPEPDTHVPFVIMGEGVRSGVRIPPGVGLDQIAPTVASVLGIHRPHPEVRAGSAIPGITDGSPPRLIVEIVWKGVGTPDLRGAKDAWPFLRGILGSGRGEGTLDAVTGSVPLDPAATLTTIGTGGLPSQHGVTGRLIRNDAGRLVEAWGAGSPTSIISTLPDDLASASHGSSEIGLVAPERSDQGLIGNGWAYPIGHGYETAITREPMPVVRRFVGSDMGTDDVPDVLGVVLDGSVASMDAHTAEIVSFLRSRRPSVAFVISASGTPAPASALPAVGVVHTVNAAVPSARPVVAAAVAGGLFLDQRSLSQSNLSSNVVAQAMLEMHSGDENLFADAFPGFAVSFARYC